MSFEVTSIYIGPTTERDSEALITLRDVNNYDVLSSTQAGMRESQYLAIVEQCDAGHIVWVRKSAVPGFKRHIEKLLNLPFASTHTPFVYGEVEVGELDVLVEVKW